MSSPRLLRDPSGVVFAEFLISFVPFFLLFLATIQLCLIYAGHLVVQHAAVQATRTAILTLDDDPCFYRGEARGLLPQKTQRAQPGVMQRALSSIGHVVDQSKMSQPAQGGLKLQRVRNAAYLPLAVLAPSASELATLLPWAAEVLPGTLTRHSVASAFGRQPSSRIAAGLLAYNRIASTITFPVRPHADNITSGAHAYGVGDLVTVRVGYLYSCDIPLVRELICESFLEMAGLSAVKDQIDAMRTESSLASAQKLAQEILERMSEKRGEQRRVAREFLQAEWTWLVPALAAQRNRFVVLRGEATLPNQGAPYPYPSELGKARCEGMSTVGDAS